MKNYKKPLNSWLIAIGCLSLSTFTIAMESLDDVGLQQVTGQAGADLSLKVSLNHTSAGVLDTSLCSDLRFCRLGISINNRYHDGTQDIVNPTTGVITPSSTGKKQWLVFKGIQGTIDIPYIGLDGEDITYASTPHAAIKLSFDPNKPIQFKNVGFESLSIETDTIAAEGAGNVAGYLTPATLYGGTGFDADKEKGFIGMKMTGNLSLTGNIKIFSCGDSHSRC
jgi:hypothetical protein